MFSVSTVLGEKASDVEQRWGASAKLPDRRPRPHWTGRGPVNEGIMFGELKFFFAFLFCFVLSSVHGCMGMAVWVNVFRVPFLRADSGPWRKMSRAWPAMSAITTSSGSTCLSDHVSAWGAAECRQERVIVEVVRKFIIAGWCSIICWTHLQMFSVSTVLGVNTSEVEQPRGASAKLPGRRPAAHWTGRGQLNKCVLFGELRVLLFVLGVCMAGQEWMCEWMSFQCHSSS